MPDASAPKAFISHATEDKERFVTEFATQLRAGGIDAWVDEWEIRAGDSLVDKVFAHGIDRARVFIVVLSETSITKLWVREELDAGMVRRINAGTKVIPVLLEDVSVPAALQHLRYVSVPQLGFISAVDDVRASVFEHPVAPPLGPIPGYTRRLPQLVPDRVDDAVLTAIVDTFFEPSRTSIDPRNCSSGSAMKSSHSNSSRKRSGHYANRASSRQSGASGAKLSRGSGPAIGYGRSPRAGRMSMSFTTSSWFTS